MMNRSIVAAVAICASIFSISSCKKDDDNKVTPQTSNPARQEMNVAYGDAQMQKMDVYFPEGYNSSTPVVFLIHGGGFVAGAKEDFTTQAQAFSKQGYITVNISHRLVDTVGILQTPIIHKLSDIKIVDELNDVDAAVNKYKSMATTWNTGTDKMYMAGHSAGAILAMLYTLGDKNKDKHIRACGNWAGVTDLSIPNDSVRNYLDPRVVEVFYRAVGFEMVTANNLAYMAVSPYWVANVNGGMPTISIYPENNVVLNTPNEASAGLQATTNFHALLRNKGVAEKLSVYAGDDHGFGKPGSWDKLIVETAVFFKEQ